MLSRPIRLLNKSLAILYKKIPLCGFFFFSNNFMRKNIMLPISCFQAAQCWTQKKSYSRSSIINWIFFPRLGSLKSFFFFCERQTFCICSHTRTYWKNLSKIVFFHQLWLLRSFNEILIMRIKIMCDFQ